MPTLPDGFADLRSIAHGSSQSVVNVIGMVDTCDNLGTTSTHDLCWNLYIQDTQVKGGLSYEKGLRICFFVRDVKDLPMIAAQGDIILVRHVQARSFQNRPFLQNDKYSTSVLVFPRATIPSPEFIEAYMGGKQQLTCRGSARAKTQLSLQEVQYVIELNAHHDELATPGQPTKLSQLDDSTIDSPDSTRPLGGLPARRPGIIGTPNGSAKGFEQTKIIAPKSRDKFRLISHIDFEPGRLLSFADVCVEVVRKYSNPYVCEILVTDYTENHMLPDRLHPADTSIKGADGDPFDYLSRSRKDFAGPYGRHVLKVTLEKPPHQKYVEDHVNQGDFVSIQNLKFKLDHHRHLQADLWTDQKYPEKLYVQRLLNREAPQVRDILRRKSDYFAKRRTMDAQLRSPASPSMPDSDVSSEQLAAQQAGMGKNAVKNKKKKVKQREQREAAARAEEAELNANRHLRCSHSDKTLTSIREIVDPHDRRHTNNLKGVFYKLPFANASFRAKVRVLDYYPQHLEDFAIYVPKSSKPVDYDDSPDDTPPWEWSFQLIVQDAISATAGEHDKITVDVGHRQAQYLLGSSMPEADDLRHHSGLLAMLRERLSILWGDLYELKQQGNVVTAPSNRPFECCISEYGVLTGRSTGSTNAWTRRYMLHGVTIL